MAAFASSQLEALSSSIYTLHRAPPDKNTACKFTIRINMHRSRHDILDYPADTMLDKERCAS